MSEEKVFGFDRRRQAVTTISKMAAPSGGFDQIQHGGAFVYISKKVLKYEFNES